MRTLVIPITDDGTVCNIGYIAEYQFTGAVDWTTVTPNPTESPIVITGLEDDTAYSVRITRLCCDGTESDYSSFDVTTTVTSPM